MSKVTWNLFCNTSIVASGEAETREQAAKDASAKAKECYNVSPGGVWQYKVKGGSKKERARDEAVEKVRTTFAAWTKAKTKLSKCRIESSLAVAREECARTEAAYREASKNRDAACEAAKS